MKYFDVHCHIQFPAYDEDRKEVIARIRDHEVAGLVVGCDMDSSRAAVELVQQEMMNGRTDLYASVGVHPNLAHEVYDPTQFEELVKHPSVVAVGECGLDYYRNEATDEMKKKQREVFEHQIELAVKYDKPLMVHSRPSKGTQDAYHDTLDLFASKKKEYGEKLRGDMHFFVGGIDEARGFIELDFSLSYTAVITFARDYDDVIRFIPLEHLLIETDSPYVAPAPHRGTRNEPTSVIKVVQALAEIRREDEEKVRQTILENVRQKLRISL